MQKINSTEASLIGVLVLLLCVVVWRKALSKGVGDTQKGIA